MSKKNWSLLVALVALATVYVCYFTDLFTPKVIQIFHTSRNVRMNLNPRAVAARAKLPTLPVIFGLGPPSKLTELKVFRLTEWQTNHNAFPIWHLTTTSNSIPLKEFFYGQNIRGMKPAVAGTHAQPLEPNVSYHMVLEAGKAKGEHDFEAKPAN